MVYGIPAKVSSSAWEDIGVDQALCGAASGFNLKVSSAALLDALVRGVVGTPSAGYKFGQKPMPSIRNRSESTAHMPVNATYRGLKPVARM